MITAKQLTAIMPESAAVAARFAAPLNAAMAEFGIVGARRVRHFIAQCGHESSEFRKLEEGMSYSAERLMQVWPTRFPTLAAATPYARRPEALANKVYANRMGNGDEKSGDGWRYRGSGLIGLTGLDNQKKCAAHFKMDVRALGDWLRTPEGACRSAAWFWKTAGCNELADRDDLDAVSDAINIGRQTEKEGDAIGYAHRKALYSAACKVIL